MTIQQSGNSASGSPFKLGEWQVKPTAGQISRNDETIHLEPRVMSVLCLLADNAGEVVSREQLENEAWPGMLVGYDALASSILKLRKALGDDSRQPRYIETVSKRGYRLIAPVNFESTELPGQKPFVLKPPELWFKKWRIYTVATILVALTSVFTISLYNKNSVGTLESDKPISNLKTLAVMPFVNISKKAEDDYFVEGVADDIATELSNLSGVLVISRGATSRYKGEAYDPRDAGKELGANYLVEGSVRKSGKRWRINARLIDSKIGTQLWAKKYEGSDASLFDSQDKLASSIVSSLALELSSKDKAKLKHHATTNFEAYDLFLQGQKLFKVRDRESNESAQDVYRKAIKLDPNFSRAYSSLSVTLAVNFWRGWSEAPTETLNRALAMANESIRLDPTSPQAYWALGYAQMFFKQHDKAIESVKHAIEISPNFADGYGLLALINNQLGNGEEAARLITKGMQLNPHYSWDYPYNLGRAYYIMGKYDDAVKTLQKALDRNDQAINPRLYLVASYVALGRQEDAEWEIEKVRIESPEATLSRLDKDYPIANKKMKEKFFNELRQAGLPE